MAKSAHPGVEKLFEYWTKGEGGAQIGWGTPGDFKRCVKLVGAKVPPNIDVEGLCSNLHKRALGVRPGQE